MNLVRNDILLGLTLLIFLESCKTSYKASEPPVQSDLQTVDSSGVILVAQQQLSELEYYDIYQAESPRENDLIHTKLELSFDWQGRSVNGIATLELVPYLYPKNQVVLDAKGFEVHHIHLLEGGETKELLYEYDGLKLFIDLGRDYTRNEHYFLEIKYTARPYEGDVTGGDAIISHRGLFFINHDRSDPDKPRQIWTQGQTQWNSRWFPTIDVPNERTTQEMLITVAKEFMTLSNGLLNYSRDNGDGTRTDYWKMDKPHAPYLFMLVVGHFSVVKDKWSPDGKPSREIEVSYYVENEYQAYARYIFGNTTEMLTFFSELLNYSFPWSKYAQVVVRDYVSGAMENTTASMFMENLQMDRRQLIDKDWDYIIAHELFHHWFGDLVTTESWSNLTLNEGFANYAEYLWNEHKHGVEEADYRGLIELDKYLAEAEEKQVDLIRFDYEQEDEMFDSHSYAKGGLILHMLRKYVGDEGFFRALNYYLKQNEYSSVKADNLRLAMEKTVGEDLNWFFDQWFFASGHPEIRVEQTYDSGIFRVTVHQEQDFQTTPIFRLPVYLDIWVNDTVERHAVDIEDQVEVFEFEMDRPDLLIFDGEQQLVGEVEHQKSMEEFAYQYSVGKKFGNRYESLLNLAQTPEDSLARRVLIGAMHDPFWANRVTAIEAFEDYIGAEAIQISEAIMRLVETDSNSNVRSSALHTLSTLDPARHLESFNRSLSDSSYLVEAAALTGYLMTAAEDKDSVVESRLALDNVDIALVLAEHFTYNREVERYTWFLDKVSFFDGIDLWHFLQYFIEITLYVSESEQSQGIGVFDHLALNHDLYYVRLMAFQGLSLFADVNGVQEKIDLIKSRERDERLLEIYDQLN